MFDPIAIGAKLPETPFVFIRRLENCSLGEFEIIIYNAYGFKDDLKVKNYVYDDGGKIEGLPAEMRMPASWAKYFQSKEAARDELIRCNQEYLIPFGSMGMTPGLIL